MNTMRWIAVIALMVLAVAVAPSTARAQANQGYWVTVAARVCDQYTDIFANKARNNVQESLKDLGPNTQYSGIYADWEVDPYLEDKFPQSRCRPLVGWKFRLGTG